MKYRNLIVVSISIVMFVLPVILNAAITNPDTMTVLVPKNHVFWYNGGAIGGYFYSPTDDRFYVYTFGSGQGMRCYTKNGIVPYFVLDDAQNNGAAIFHYFHDNDGDSWQCSTTSDMYRITLSRDIPAGLYNSNDVGTSAPMFDGSVVNPAPVVFNGITYPAGKLAIIANYNKGPTIEATKEFLTWDLREIWSPTTVQPDNDNAQWDGAAPSGDRLEIEHFGPERGFGCTNWNDAFRCLVSLRDTADAIGATVTAPMTTNQISSRRGCFSPDASKLYFISMESSSTNRQFTGVWSVRISDKKVRRLYNDVSSPKIITTSEPAAIKVGVRNFSGLPYNSDMVQVLFNGTEASGNVGGINMLIDNDTNNAPVYPVMDANNLLAFFDIPTPEPNQANRPKIWAIANDSVGNIYFDLRAGMDANVIAGIYKYDTQGRIISVASRATAFVNVLYNNFSPSNVNGNRLDLRMVANPYNPSQQIPQIMWANSSLTGITGAYIYKSCDFNRDGDINVADTDFFKAQFKKSNGTLPLVADGNTFNDYLKADLNGTGIFNADKTGLISACVTNKDTEILYQFIKPGDSNFDGIVDFKDFAKMAEHFKGSGIKNWEQGDYNFDDSTDISDVKFLAEHWLEEYEL
jgi:hypothetical protein